MSACGGVRHSSTSSTSLFGPNRHFRSGRKFACKDSNTCCCSRSSRCSAAISAASVLALSTTSLFHTPHSTACLDRSLPRRMRRRHRFAYAKPDHVQLLGELTTPPCPALLSGHPAALNDESLRGVAEPRASGDAPRRRAHREGVVRLLHLPPTAAARADRATAMSQGVTPRSREKRIGRLPLAFPQPSTQHRHRFLTKRCASDLPAFAQALYVCASAQDDVLAAKSDDFCRPQSSLHGEEQYRSIAPPAPGFEVWSCKQSVRLRQCEKADGPTCSAEPAALCRPLRPSSRRCSDRSSGYSASGIVRFEFFLSSDCSNLDSRAKA